MKTSISIYEALLPILTMAACLVVGGFLMPMGADLLVPVMLIAAAVSSIPAIRMGHSFADIQKVTGEKLAAVLPALLILLAIGMLIGTWVVAGAIPYLVYIGLKLIDPQYIILTAFLVTAIMSIATGTSWGSAGTVGVALMGMAQVTGVSSAACAGAVLSGAYFGDKMSPLSDSTNICAIGARVDLYTHIRHMLYTAVPSFILAGVVYLVAGVGFDVGGAGAAHGSIQLISELERGFHLSPIVLLPVLVVIGGVIKRYPPVLVMAVSSLSAIVLGVWVQDVAFGDALASAVSGSRAEMLTQLVDPSPALLKLVNRGGLFGMVGNFVMILAAFILAAGLEVSGALDMIIRGLLATATNVFRLIAATMLSGVTMIALTSHGGVTSLIVGELFQGAYRERGLAPQNLSRSLEDSVTITEPLMPWTVSAVFMAGTLGVSTMEYAPWAVFCYTGCFFSLFWAALFNRTGWGLARITGETIDRGE